MILVSVVFIGLSAFSIYKEIGASMLVAALMFPVGAICLMDALMIKEEFIGKKWALWADLSEFIYEGSSKWSVSMDSIARVEIAKTKDSLPARKYKGGIFGGGGLQLVPEHEWQTFLFLNDGTRRVVHIANADRDGCAALAASIREYVETARAAADPQSSDTSPAAPADGFDL